MLRAPTTDLVRYLEGLAVSQGRLAGQAFAVLPWQRRFVRGAFRGGVQSAALSVARGNGKTALLSGIAAATLNVWVANSNFEQKECNFLVLSASPSWIR